MAEFSEVWCSVCRNTTIWERDQHGRELCAACGAPRAVSANPPVSDKVDVLISVDTTADYILKWLPRRNGGELQEAFENMRVRDARNLREELVIILRAGGKPTNWE